MKKITYIIAASAAIASFASCNKNISEVPEAKINNYTIYVEGNDWAEDAVKSSYAPGVGITISGKEKMGLLSKDAYEDAAFKSYVESGAYKNYVVKATGSNGVYHITTDAEKIVNKDGSSRENDIWFPFIPFSQIMVRPNSAISTLNLCAGPIQFPKADSFDPMKDFLVGKPFKFNGSDEAEVKNWKRVLAPVCVKLKGLSGSEVYVASMTIDVPNLAGYGTLSMGEKPTDCYATPVASGRTASPTVTAVYEEPLAQNADGTWHVWYMVYPQDISGKTLTMEVATDDKTYTRTVTLNDNIEFRADKFNEITIDLSKPGTTTVNSLSQVFVNTSITSGEQTLIGSDGSFLTWSLPGDTATASGLDNSSDIRPGLRINNGKSMTLPYKAGIKKIKVYSHPLNPNNSNAMFLSLNGSTDDALRKRTNFGDGKGTIIGDGGFLTFDLSSLSSYNELVMKLVPEGSKNEKCCISAIVYEF